MDGIGELLLHLFHAATLAALGFFLADATLLVPFFDVLGLPFLL